MIHLPTVAAILIFGLVVAVFIIVEQARVIKRLKNKNARSLPSKATTAND